MAWKTGVPRVTPGVAGLFVALEAARNGDGESLAASMRIGLREIASFAEATGSDPASAEEIAGTLLRRVSLSTGRHAGVRDPAAWLATGVRRARIDQWRGRRRERALAASFLRVSGNRSSEDPADAAEEGEACERLAKAIFLLPTPYREAMLWQKVEGWGRREIVAALQRWGGVGREEARRVLRVGHYMLEVALTGLHPCRIWPRRYPRILHNRRWNATPPPSHPASCS